MFKNDVNLDTENENKLESEKNDWDQDDEDWEDWGDAEDNITESTKVESNINTKTYSKATSVESFNNNIRNDKIQTTNPNKVSEKGDDNQTQTVSNSSSWGMWKPSWGGALSSVISTATEGLTSISQGLTQVIGVPDPEELARINVEEAAKTSNTFHEKEKVCDEQSESKTTTPVGADKIQSSTVAPAFGLSLQTLGSKVLNTGLDTLEGIGKKTMNILQENDPMLMNKRKLLGLEPDRPNLSEVLKEAKNDAEQLENTIKKLEIEKSNKLLSFEMLFENYCGLVHLEALEILSKESALKLQTLLDAVSGNALTELKETISEVEELLELEDLEGESDGNYDAKELNEKLTAAIDDADLQINFDDVVNCWSQTLDWITSDELDTMGEQELYSKCITTLAQTCAYEMNKLHKIGELLLVKEHHSTANEVDSIVQVCKHFHLHLNGLTNRFAGVLSKKSGELAKEKVSNIFAEMLVATSHIEKAFKLFLPILQIGAV